MSAAHPSRSQRPLGPGDDVGALPGVNAARRAAFARMGIHTVEDLLRLAPRRYEDRRHPVAVADLAEGTVALVVADVTSSRTVRARGGLTILEAVLQDATGAVTARWFQRGFLRRPLPVGQRFALYGPVKRRGRRLELAGPALERIPGEGEASGGEPAGAGRLVPVHPLTSGLTAPAVRRAAWAALAAAPQVEDPVPPAVGRACALPRLAQALTDLHVPATEEDAERARRRLAFDELLVHEILLARRRLKRQAEPAWPIVVDERVDERIRRRLPFGLTPGQETVVRDVVADLARPWPMSRLVQGDVGSGKTAVAAYALLAVVASGAQGAFMAPTEVLARQHERTLRQMLEGSRVRIETLLGARRVRERRDALARIGAGEVDLVLGTHAVLSSDVRFCRLALVVVDEQHKFGVRQRHELVEKGGADDGAPRPHCLVMTATPIPRTLALAVYGDLDLSILEGKPPGRQRVETWVVGPDEGRRVFARVKEELARGHQVFVIYPLIGESDKLGLRDATVGRERWARALPGRHVALLHGRMAREEKDAAMEAFRRGVAQVLVATVVVEVGVDVPNATVLVVEHAERFGLSQLHQLRGRIGRGEDAGLCVLVDRASEERAARLDVLAATDDGFEIAEEDLKLRGTGDLLGTRQHGAAGFRAALLPRDLPVLQRARRAARGVLAADPALGRPEHRALAALVAARIRSAGGEMEGG